jgi:hypothetical protein
MLVMELMQRSEEHKGSLLIDIYDTLPKNKLKGSGLTKDHLSQIGDFMKTFDPSLSQRDIYSNSLFLKAFEKPLK